MLLRWFILLMSVSYTLMILGTPLSAATPTLTLNENIGSFTDFEVEYFEDKSKTPLTIEQVRKEKFETTSNAFTFGYKTNNFWFRFNITNRSTKEKEIFIELTEIIHKHVDLYVVSSDNREYYEKNGLSIPVEERNIKVSTPTFSLHFEAGEQKEIYIRLATIYGAFGAIFVKSPQSFYDTTQLKNNIYTFYFGAIITIALYNLFLYLFLREKVYLYYVSYVFAFMVWFSNYKGILLPFTDMQTYDFLQISVPIFFILLIRFSQKILETKRLSPRFHQMLNVYIVILAIVLIWIVADTHTGFYVMNVIGALLLPLLLFVAFWSLKKRQNTAKIYLTAVSIYFVCMLILSQMALGFIPYTVLISNLAAIGSFFEILLFSILLAYRVNVLRQEKIETQEKLLKQETTESMRLSKMVEVRTKKLDTALQKHKLLLDELNHRVKNNMQFIVSLYTLSLSGVANRETLEKLKEMELKIKSMRDVHEMLYMAENIEKINANEYFSRLIEKLVDAYEIDKDTIMLKAEGIVLSATEAIYAGLILNELITNSIKYAFVNHKGEIEIIFTEEDGNIILEYSDSGEGYDFKSSNGSFGLMMIKTLVEEQLKGKMEQHGASFRMMI